MIKRSRLDVKLLEEVKKAFVPLPGGADPNTGAPPGAAPPMDPSMGGMPPGMDPAMMGGGGMPPGMDPSMMGGMPPGGAGAPPMDPAMAGGAPPVDPAAAGGMPPGGDPAAMGGDPAAGGDPMAQLAAMGIDPAMLGGGGDEKSIAMSPMDLINLVAILSGKGGGAPEGGAAPGAGGASGGGEAGGGAPKPKKASTDDIMNAINNLTSQLGGGAPPAPAGGGMTAQASWQDIKRKAKETGKEVVKTTKPYVTKAIGKGKEMATKGKNFIKNRFTKESIAKAYAYRLVELEKAAGKRNG